MTSFVDDDSYTAASIQVLSGAQAVRRRPGMYLGGVGAAAMHAMLWEVVGAAIDEQLCGFGTRVAIAIDGERITVDDDGRGRSFETIVRDFTQLSGMFVRSPDCHPRNGLANLGLVPTCALSEELVVTSRRESIQVVQRFARGEVAGDPKHTRVQRGNRTGTWVAFKPDRTILETHPWDRTEIERRCRALVALFPGMTIELDGVALRSASLGEFVSELGLARFEPFVAHEVAGEIELDVAFGWSPEARGAIHGHVNCVPIAKGTHVTGFVSGIRAGLARRFPWNTARVLRGITAAIHVRHPAPRFSRYPHDELDDREVHEAMRELMAREVPRYLEATPAFLDALILAVSSANGASPARRSSPRKRVRSR